MISLPNRSSSLIYDKGCSEKIKSYNLLSLLKFPVLKSIIVTQMEISKFSIEKEEGIKKYLGSNKCMIRYLYKKPCSRVKNGGKIVLISRESLKKEMEEEADYWLLEPVRREDNIYSCNICLNKLIGNIHIEILGKGFDISDINKGKICPHEWVDMPYPIWRGAYGEWWKWAKFNFCSKEEYKESIVLRKNRLKEFGIKEKVDFDLIFKPLGLDFFNQVFFWVQKFDRIYLSSEFKLYNFSISIRKDGKIIFWDIQTPEGKLKAYN